MTDNNGLPEAGWHDDPQDPTQWRYWDGAAWTDHRSPKPGAAQPSPAYASPVQPSNTAAMPHDATARAKSGAPWWLTAVLSVVSLLVGIGIGFGIGAGASAGDEAIATPTTSAPEPTGSKQKGSFDDSGLTALEDLTALGGADVPAGVYRVVDPVSGDGGVNGGILMEHSCKWGLYAGAERGIDQIQVAYVADGGHPVMRIADGQRAYSQNCGAWARLDADTPGPGDLATAIGDGYWVAGIDMVPGTYKRLGLVDADDPETWCVWTVLESYEPDAAVVVQEFDFSGEGPRTVDVADGQVLSSSTCGGWERV